jgi:endonuclease YncB( thermonuclease family)
VAAAALLAATVWALQHGGSIEIAGHPRAIDGDTIAFGRVHVRLYGIAAPESDQTCSNAASDLYPCGALATSALLQLVDGEHIICHADSWNLNRRLLATCWRGDLDLGREMVREGQAIAYGHFSTVYLADEDEARAQRRGIWQGIFQ